MDAVGDLLTSNFLLPIILQRCQVLPCLCLLALMDLIFSQIKDLTFYNNVNTYLKKKEKKEEEKIQQYLPF